MLVVVAAAVLVALDFFARYTTQDAIARDVRSSTHSGTASASISSFPFIYDVAAEGRLDQVTVVDRVVPVGPIRLDQVRLVASQVHFDRHQLLTNHTVRLTGVDSATVTVSAHLSSLAGKLVRDLGVQVTSSASGRISISAEGVPVATIDLTRVPLIPDCPLQITHSGDSYDFTCTVSPVPASVLNALSQGRNL